MQSVNYIISAKHYAERMGVESVLKRIRKLATLMQGRQSQIMTHLADEPRGFAVFGEIEFGQWIARCECGGAEFVDANEPVFMCFGCANRNNLGYLRPVVFPTSEIRAEIERLILERPVDDLRGLDDLDRAPQARALVYAQVVQADGSMAVLPLSRSWTPDETVDDLVAQNQAVYAWQASLSNGGD